MRKDKSSVEGPVEISRVEKVRASTFADLKARVLAPANDLFVQKGQAEEALRRLHATRESYADKEMTLELSVIPQARRELLDFVAKGVDLTERGAELQKALRELQEVKALMANIDVAIPEAREAAREAERTFRGAISQEYRAIREEMDATAGRLLAPGLDYSEGAELGIKDFQAACNFTSPGISMFMEPVGKNNPRARRFFARRERP